MRLETVLVVCLCGIQGFLLLMPSPVPSISVDFAVHNDIAHRVLSGDLVFADSPNPIGVHYFLAFGLWLGIPIRLTMGLVGGFAPLLVYLVVVRMSDRKLALLGATLFVGGSGGLWWVGIVYSGLYSNYVANMISLAILAVALRLTDKRLIIRYGPLVFGLSFLLFLTHYSAFILLGALWIFLALLCTPILVKQKIPFDDLGKLSCLWVLMLCGLMATGFGVTVAPGQEYDKLLSLREGNAGLVIITFKDSFKDFFATVSPFLLYLYVYMIRSPVLLFATLIGLPVTIIRSVRSRQVWPLFIALWFILIWAGSPYSEMAWRFSYYAALPLTLLMPLCLRDLAYKLGYGRLNIRAKMIVIGLLTVASLIGSYPEMMFNPDTG